MKRITINKVGHDLEMIKLDVDNWGFPFYLIRYGAVTEKIARPTACEPFAVYLVRVKYSWSRSISVKYFIEHWFDICFVNINI